MCGTKKTGAAACCGCTCLLPVHSPPSHALAPLSNCNLCNLQPCLVPTPYAPLPFTHPQAKHSIYRSNRKPRKPRCPCIRTAPCQVSLQERVGGFRPGTTLPRIISRGENFATFEIPKAQNAIRPNDCNKTHKTCAGKRLQNRHKVPQHGHRTAAKNSSGKAHGSVCDNLVHCDSLCTGTSGMQNPQMSPDCATFLGGEVSPAKLSPDKSPPLVSSFLCTCLIHTYRSHAARRPRSPRAPGLVQHGGA